MRALASALASDSLKKRCAEVEYKTPNVYVHDKNRNNKMEWELVYLHEAAEYISFTSKS